MFATLLGAYPADPDLPDDDARVRDVVAELDAAGLEPVSDGQTGAGLASPVPSPFDPEAVVRRWRIAAAATRRAVKQALPGPYSLARRGAAGQAGAEAGAGAGAGAAGQAGAEAGAGAGAGAEAGAVARSGPAADAAPEALAERLRATIEALAAAGCPLVEVEEPEARSIGDSPAERRAFGNAHRRLAEGLAGSVHLSLVLTGGNVDGAGAATFFDLPYASYAFDLVAGPDNWRLIAAAPGDRGIVCGALDPAAAADDRPEPLVWAAHYAASSGGRGLVRVGLANASGLAGLDRERARRKLMALAEAARIASVGSTEELAARLDPRAVDSRSAAFGRVVPRPPRRRR